MNPPLALVVQMGAGALRKDDRANTAAALEGLVAEAVDERTALLVAAEEVLACRQNGSFGSDGAQGFALLEKAVARAKGGAP